jgi:hypothetical protein
MMAISFGCGAVVCLGVAFAVTRALAGSDSAVGADDGVGANASQSPQASVTASPDLGADPDATASTTPTYVEVPRTDTSNGNGGTAPGVPVGGSAECPQATVTVSDEDSLQVALDSAKPGDVISMADGVYDGEFATTASGTSGSPIFLCGTAKAILDGDGHSGGYVMHLDGAKYWRLVGFTVRNGQKGVMADGTVGSIIQGLTIHSIGDEALHLRKFSTDNTVVGNTIYDTGNRRDKFGEGVYVGSAQSNWCNVTDCEPDRSDRNVIKGNVIYGVTAEGIDIKEGTTGGIATGNTFDGGSMTGDGGDSWVDVKGNEWLIEDNVGKNSSRDGFQVHKILSGWGKGNVFRGNTATVNGPGFGFSLTPEQDNVVACSNTVTSAKEGYANVSCR